MSVFTEFVKNIASTVAYGRIGEQQAPATQTGIQSQKLSEAIKSVKSKASLDMQRVDEDSVPESWVELGAPPSRGSVCSSVEALYISNDMVNMRSGIWSKSKSQNQSPNNEMETSDSIKARSIVPPGKNTEWMWDWSSRCEAVPPKEYQRMMSGSKHMSGSRQHMVQSNLTTPPNSPIPVDNGLSWRHSVVVKAQSYNTDVLFGLIVSNLITFILGSCIGYYVAKRIHDSQKAA